MEIVNPTGTELRHGFQGKWKNEQDYHAMRVHGWLTPPQSSDYSFAFGLGEREARHGADQLQAGSGRLFFRVTSTY